ncbi:MAG: hypothetical protein JEZ09_02655 [Salinivirgaceae bacterium]|nr:hypothetical protein [Salinivirgaceae bacterium]
MKKEERDQELQKLLQKASKGNSRFDLTSVIMNQVIALEVKNKLAKKYLRRSWIFVGLASLLAIKLLYIFSYFQTSFIASIDIYYPGFAQVFLYFTISGLIGWFLYQINSIVSMQMSLK